uniref:Uncharacterized protein n=1 Tax=Rhizophora mucronata TaxID=61149 RepID=A0A2P2N8T9_RHIMU
MSMHVIVLLPNLKWRARIEYKIIDSSIRRGITIVLHLHSSAVSFSFPIPLLVPDFGFN